MVWDADQKKQLGSEKRLQIMSRGSAQVESITRAPSWYHNATSIPVMDVRTKGEEVAKPSLKNCDIAFVYTYDIGYAPFRPSFLEVGRYDSGGKYERVFELRNDPRKYRLAWAYPLVVVGTPFALVFDFVALPVTLVWFFFHEVLRDWT